MKSISILLAVLAILASGVAACAHHSYAATYDTNKQITIEGNVAQFVLRNPHSYLHIFAPDENGDMQRWAVEWGGAGRLIAQGITRDTLVPRDLVVITGDAGRDPADHRLLMKTIERVKDGFTWGTGPDEVVD